MRERGDNGYNKYDSCPHETREKNKKEMMVKRSRIFIHNK
jgi:hypothetical protein